jgi:hypothetical protein
MLPKSRTIDNGGSKGEWERGKKEKTADFPFVIFHFSFVIEETSLDEKYYS